MRWTDEKLKAVRGYIYDRTGAHVPLHVLRDAIARVEDPVDALTGHMPPAPTCEDGRCGLCEGCTDDTLHRAAQAADVDPTVTVHGEPVPDALAAQEEAPVEDWHAARTRGMGGVSDNTRQVLTDSLEAARNREKAREEARRREQEKAARDEVMEKQDPLSPLARIFGGRS